MIYKDFKTTGKCRLFVAKDKEAFSPNLCSLGVQDTSPKRHKSLASEVPNYFFASQVPWKIKLKRHKTQIRRQKWLTQSVIGPKYFKYN